eukprot:m.46444 g.46444  ORF g.46444 m.46444 type:complete len:53 (-) comp15159_c0_seq7:1389-1547(-)
MPIFYAPTVMSCTIAIILLSKKQLLPDTQGNNPCLQQASMLTLSQTYLPRVK